MRKIILNVAVTLDGFIEGKNGEIDWLSTGSSSSGSEDHFDRFLAEIDTIFYGRVSYEKWGEYQPSIEALPPERKLWEGVHSKKKVVFSTSLNSVKGNAKIISKDIMQYVHDIKNQPGKDIWLYGGSVLVSAFMELGLVDRFLLAVFPVVLGSGKPLFNDLNKRTNLRLNEIKTSASGVILLDYKTAI